MADTNERELAEQRYVGLAHDYESNPIGSRDWVIFWNGWRERSELKATPLPADAALIGKLRHQLAQATDEAARLRALSQPAVDAAPILAYHPDCNYTGQLGKVCSKCGNVHQHTTIQIPVSGVSGQQPATVAQVGDSQFESWFAEYNPSGKGDKQRARDAYAAGMGDTAQVAQVPEGFVLVPIEPTEAMIIAGDGWSITKRGELRTVYRAMLSAVPSAKGDKQ